MYTAGDSTGVDRTAAPALVTSAPLSPRNHHDAEFGFRGVGPDVPCAGAALRCHPVGTTAETTPQVSWALGGRRWPPPIAAVGPLGALHRPGCAHRPANSVSGGLGRMYPALGRRYGVTPSVHRRNPLDRWAGHSGGAGGRHQSPRLGPWGCCRGRCVRTGGRIDMIVSFLCAPRCDRARSAPSSSIGDGCERPPSNQPT